MTITTVGLDLAKNVFQAHGVDERSKAGLRKQLKRGQMAEVFANLPPCLIGIAAAARLQRGSGWCPDNIRAAASRRCSA